MRNILRMREAQSQKFAICWVFFLMYVYTDICVNRVVSVVLIRMNTKLPALFNNVSQYFIFARKLNCWTAAITKKHRKIYERTYPTVLVLPNGSTINVDYFEPRKIIKLPLDLSQLSEAERKKMLERRIPRTKVKVMDDDDDDSYDATRYINYGKR